MPELTIQMIPTDKLGIYRYNTNIIHGRKLLALSESIKNEGIIEPLTVAKIPNGVDCWDLIAKTDFSYDTPDYVVVNGNHRLAIAQNQKITELPCIIRKVKDVKELMRLSININHFRGEPDVEKLSSLVTERLNQGITIKSLADELGMNEWWLLYSIQWFKEQRRSERAYMEQVNEKNPANQWKEAGIILPLYLQFRDIEPLIDTGRHGGLIGTHTDISLLSRKISFLLIRLLRTVELDHRSRSFLSETLRDINDMESRFQESAEFMKRADVLKYLDDALHDLSFQLRSSNISEAMRKIVKLRQTVRSDSWWKQKMKKKSVFKKGGKSQ